VQKDRAEAHQTRNAVMKNDLAARAKAYAASTTEPIHPWLLEQVRRDADTAHRWLAQQGKQS